MRQTSLVVLSQPYHVNDTCPYECINMIALIVLWQPTSSQMSCLITEKSLPKLKTSDGFVVQTRDHDLLINYLIRSLFTSKKP